MHTGSAVSDDVLAAQLSASSFTLSGAACMGLTGKGLDHLS